MLQEPLRRKGRYEPKITETPENRDLQKPGRQNGYNPAETLIPKKRRGAAEQLRVREAILQAAGARIAGRNCRRSPAIRTQRELLVRSLATRLRALAH